MFDPDYLSNFYGSEQFYRHWTGRLIYTDGIHYLVENEAAWLVDAIASHQGRAKLKRDLNYFQLWELTVNPDRTAVLTCKADSGEKPVITQRIEYTDFPMDSITLYVERGEHLTLMLPSER